MTIETPNLSNAPSSEQQFKPSECPETFPEAWFTWSKFFRVCLGNSEDAKTETAQYSFADSVVKRKSQCGRCEIYRDWLLEYSPIVRFMRENIRKVGGPDMNSQNIHCVWCDPLDPAQRRFGYFDPTRGVVLCQNFLLSRKDAEDTVTHEMVHAYDLMRFDYDNKNLKHVACTEVLVTTFTCASDLGVIIACEIENLVLILSLCRYAPPCSVGNAGGHGSSGAGSSGPLLDTFRNAFVAGRCCLCRTTHTARIRITPKKS